MNKNRYRILMATNSLDIGGAETHVVELSRGLQQLGYQVYVASNGGRYEKELATSNIQHFQLPLNRRGLWAFIRSFWGLIHIVQKQKIDLIHAHARIPALLLYLVSRINRIPLVTTVHYPFYVNPLLKLFTIWSPYSIAVSQDLKEYLIEKYHFPPQKISIIPNGIDIHKFYDQDKPRDVLQEFGWQKDQLIIIYVSRLTGQFAEPAQQLLKSIPSVWSELPQLRVLVVGDGDKKNELSTLADNINQKLGQTIIQMAGARHDLPRLLPAADAVVAVSRAALEAMSCCRPVILAGSQGYLGVFSANKFDICRETNFTGRGTDLTCADKLSKDILWLFREKTPEERKMLGLEGRYIVEKYYSAQAMAHQTHIVYKSALNQA